MKNQHMAEFINELKYGDIAKYGRRGDTMIAHINPNEAAMLKRMGGAGTINPMTGLPEFFYEGSDWSEGVSDSTGGTGGGTGSNEGSGGVDDNLSSEDYTESELAEAEFDTLADLFSDPTPQSTQGIADIANQFGLTIDEAAEFLGPTGVGRGGPDEFSGVSTDVASDIAALRNILNKEGMTREQAVYFNALKARGLSNEDAIAALAAALGTPGGAAALSSGYRDGYSYGGPMGTLEGVFADRMSAINEAAARERKEQEKADKEAEGPFDEPGEFQAEPDPGFFGRIGDVLGSLNPLGELTPEEQAVLQSHRDAGFLTDVRERSTMDNLLGFAANLAMPGPLSAVKFVGEKATGANIIGLATDPATGFDYLVQANGDLQLAPGQLGDLSPQDGGNYSEDKKRVTSSEPKKEEEEEKEEEEVEAAEKKEIKPSAYQEYLADLLYSNTSDIFKKAV